MLLFSRYEYNPDTDLLGEGGFSKVFRAFDTKLKRPVALKFFSPGKTDARYNISSEIERVVQLDHPNICRYYDTEEIVYTSPTGQKDTTQVAILELLTGGDLKKYFQQGVSEAVQKKLLIEILGGLAYLHENHIIHRDIKPQNILIKETPNGPVAKIVDFGISKNTDSAQNKSSAVLGSIEYMAPEQFNAVNYGINGRISTNVDLWAFGTMLYELLTHSQPFGSRDTGDTSEQLMHKILGDDVDGRINTVEEPYRSAIQRCLVKDANQRVQKAEDIITIMENEKRKVKAVPTEVFVLHTAERDQAGEIRVEKADRKEVTSESADKTRKKPVIMYAVTGVILIAVVLLAILLWLVGNYPRKEDLLIANEPILMTDTVSGISQLEDDTSVSYSDSAEVSDPIKTGGKGKQEEHLAAKKQLEEIKQLKESLEKQKDDQAIAQKKIDEQNAALKTASEKIERERIASENAAKAKVEKERIAKEQSAIDEKKTATPGVLDNLFLPYRIGMTLDEYQSKAFPGYNPSPWSKFPIAHEYDNLNIEVRYSWKRISEINFTQSLSNRLGDCKDNSYIAFLFKQGKLMEISIRLFSGCDREKIIAALGEIGLHVGRSDTPLGQIYVYKNYGSAGKYEIKYIAGGSPLLLIK